VWQRYPFNKARRLWVVFCPECHRRINGAGEPETLAKGAYRKHHAVYTEWCFDITEVDSFPKRKLSSGLPNRKGAKFERYCVQKILERMPGEEIKRTRQSMRDHGMQDVVMPVFWTECKHRKVVGIEAALAQAEETCPEGRVPLAITRVDNKPVNATMRFEAWLDILEEWWFYRKQYGPIGGCK